MLAAVADGLPTRTRVCELDITDEAALERAAVDVGAHLGTLRRGGQRRRRGGRPFVTSDPALWRRVIDVNLTGSAATARAFLPDLMATQGYYLQVASLASIGAAPMMSAYCASKAGVEAFAHSLRAEVAHHGVAVGIGYVNWTDTDMIRDADRHPVLRELRGHMPPPARRLYPADRVAARLGAGVEHRSTAVYVPCWLRLAQAARAALPPVVLRVSRRELARLEAEDPCGTPGSSAPAAPPT
ncbi:SDR family oxidoreductase [Streptomyces sp. KM77-8]|uniref:SDR family oxidoreductase n=1 Tax=Streptomyces haneummycinicus TaxID=3074435 RepID=A0AAT9HK72_9ACTN